MQSHLTSCGTVAQRKKRAALDSLLFVSLSRAQGVNTLVAWHGMDAKQNKLNIQLDDAINIGNLAKVRALLVKGADIEYEDPFGATPLMNAAWVGSIEIVEFLMSKGADIRHKDKEGFTVLEKVKTIGHNEYAHDAVIHFLVEASRCES